MKYIKKQITAKLDKLRGVISNTLNIQDKTTNAPSIQLTQDLIKECLLASHPVGSYYWSKQSTSPATLFGGTWERVTDRFILAAGSIYSQGSTGGEATHTLTISEMPSHNHRSAIGQTKVDMTLMGIGGNNSVISSYNYVDRYYYNYTNGQVAGAVGDGAAHNNMPPYEVAYCWVRVS